MPLIQGTHISGTSLPQRSRFAQELTELIGIVRPLRILETGTFRGTGTTRVIGEAIKAHHLPADFRSIECRREHCDAAQAIVSRLGLPVRLCHGISLPRNAMPDAAQIDASLRLLDERPEPIFADFRPDERIAWYHAETNYPDVADDLIGRILQEWNGRADLVLLDSAGHLGYREFLHTLACLKSPCWFCLDDTRHVKHVRSLEHMREDPRFRVTVDSDEKFGFAIGFYQPTV